MLTPWFAAGAGIVIAAAVAVGSPAALTYSPSGPGVRCSVSSCTGPAPDRPDVATASPGVVLQVQGGQPRRAAAGRSGPPRSAKPGGGAGYLVGYQVIGARRHGFVAIITMPGDLMPGSWSLAFAFPSARVDRVWGALWQASGNGQGGTALGPMRWTGHHPGGPGGRQFVVLASGTPTAPSSCRLNGIRCSFG
jgi:Cellulose binding domain